jgi:propanol-preferring alcohol dehydrogenase
VRALQLVEPTVLEIVDVPVPVPGEDEVLLRVHGAGLCHSDLHLRQVPIEVFPLPLTPGHEVAGTVETVGRDGGGLSCGDAVLVHLIWACGRCRACDRGDDNVCEAAGRMAQPPTPGLGPAGGMAEYMAVPVRHLVPIGDLDPIAAAPLADSAMTPYHAIRNSRRVLRPDATAVVIGVGGLGHLAVQILRATTAVRIVAVDIDQTRLHAAVGHGADQSLLADDHAASAILDLTGGRGADAVFDFVGAQSTVDLAVNVIAPDGIVQIVGVSGGMVDISAGPRFGQGWPYGASLRTSYGGTRSDLGECVAVARAGRIGVDVVRFALDDGIDAFDRLEAGQINGRAVLVPLDPSTTLRSAR